MLEKLKEKTKSDLQNALEWYRVFVDEMSSVDKQLFELKLGVAGFLALTFSIIFSSAENLKYFSPFFKYGVLVIMVSIILLLIEEIWLKAKEGVSKLSLQNRRVILLKIRDYAMTDPSRFEKYGVEAEKLYFEEDKFLNEMKSNKPLEEMIEIHRLRADYRIHLLLWSALPILALLLFCVEIYLH